MCILCQTLIVYSYSQNYFFFLKHILCGYVGLYGCIARLVMVAK